MKKSVISLALCVLMSTSVSAGESEVAQIEQAAATLNTSALSAYSQSMQGYDKALVLYRLAMSQHLLAQEEQAKVSLDQAIAHLQDLLENQALDDESKGELSALLSQAYGYKIAFNPMKGMYYGPKADAMLEQAQKYAPNSPRVHLVKGISAYNTPALFGGSKEQALKHFDKALALFAQEQGGAYSWGEAEAYTWRGVTQLDLGQSDEANLNWQQALEVNPDYGWAKMLIAKNK